MALLMGVVFAMPVVLGTAIYFSGWRPAPTAAHGKLVVPPQPVADVALGKERGRAVGLADFRDRWTLLTIGPANCPADCRFRLYAMRQAHVAQGAAQARVQRVFVARGGLSGQDENALLSAYPGMRVVAAAGGGNGWPDGWADRGRIYLIDPLGNLVMSYGGGSDAGGIRRDLSRLLAYSWVG